MRRRACSRPLLTDSLVERLVRSEIAYMASVLEVFARHGEASMRWFDHVLAFVSHATDHRAQGAPMSVDISPAIPVKGSGAIQQPRLLHGSITRSDRDATEASAGGDPVVLP
jgi:hypothetical protein